MLTRPNYHYRIFYGPKLALKVTSFSRLPPQWDRLVVASSLANVTLVAGVADPAFQRRGDRDRTGDTC